MMKALWPKSITRAREVQRALSEKVRVAPLTKQPHLVAGVDAAFIGDRVTAAAAVYAYPTMEPVEEGFATRKGIFPYVPGLLTSREGPAIVSALKRLRNKPDLILFDGQGIAHPVGIGIASHMGVLLGIPSIGCAKSRLVGEFEEPGPERGEWSPLFYRGRQVGVVLRTRSHIRPVFVSPGHLIDIDTSREIVMGCTKTYRIPEPLRRADHLSRMAGPD